MLRVDSALNGMSVKSYVFLAKRQFLAGRDQYLRLDDVYPGDHLRDRVLHLNSGIHFDEEEFALFIKELEGTCAAVPDFAAGVNAALPDAPPLLPRNKRRRGLLDYFLVPALHGAIPVTQIDSVAVFIGKDLYLDVTRSLEKLFHIYGGVAEGRFCFLSGHGYRVDQRSLGMYDTHAASAAAACSLDADRTNPLSGNLVYFRRLVRQRTFAAWNDGDPCLDHRVFGAHLVA